MCFHIKLSELDALYCGAVNSMGLHTTRQCNAAESAHSAHRLELPRIYTRARCVEGRTSKVHVSSTCMYTLVVSRLMGRELRV